MYRQVHVPLPRLPGGGIRRAGNGVKIVSTPNGDVDLLLLFRFEPTAAELRPAAIFANIEHFARDAERVEDAVGRETAGFEDDVPYIVGVVDLEEGGRALAWFGESVKEEDIEIGMELQVVPQIFDEVEEIKVYYSLEKPGTPWSKTDSK